MRLLRENATRADLWTVWSDFVEMAALAIANSVDLAQREPREARYMAIVGRYNKEQAQRFGQALGALTMALETSGFDDVLGAVFMELELGSKWAGQFFTPYHLCSLMARMNVGDELTAKLADKGFITVSDPCVGAGAMPIAMAQAMHDAGHNYQLCMHVTAQDVDSRAVHMAYIQLSLLHVPAVVILGNSLAVECREQWFTPAHVIGGWDRKLACQDARAPAAAPPAPDVQIGQPELEGLFD